MFCTIFYNIYLQHPCFCLSSSSTLPLLLLFLSTVSPLSPSVSLYVSCFSTVVPARRHSYLWLCLDHCNELVQRHSNSIDSSTSSSSNIGDGHRRISCYHRASTIISFEPCCAVSVLFDVGASSHQLKSSNSNNKKRNNGHQWASTFLIKCAS